MHKLVLNWNLERRCHEVGIDCLDFQEVLLQALDRAWHIDGSGEIAQGDIWRCRRQRGRPRGGQKGSSADG